MRYAFFGSARISSLALSELKKINLLPSVIITSPDKKKGRGMKIAPNEVKTLGLELNIPVLSPDRLDADFVKEMVSRGCDIFLVAGYGKILPKNILEIPGNGSLNIHPSSLPKYRGPSPIESAILGAETKASCCLMLMDEQMDHGPIIAEKTIDMIEDEAVLNFLKYKAYKGWPGTFFFVETDGKKNRAIIREATLENDKFVINKVLPEGGKETDFKTFAKSHPETNPL